MSDATAATQELEAKLTARLETARRIIGAHAYHGSGIQSEAAWLLAGVDALLNKHRSEPLYANADRGECGCPVPGGHSSISDEASYAAAHPEGYGPGGTGIVCTRKIVGRWCPGCADIAVERDCLGTPAAYPPENCAVRRDLTQFLLSTQGVDV